MTHASAPLFLIVAASSLCACGGANHPAAPPSDSNAIISVPPALGGAGTCGIGNGIAEQALVAAARLSNPDGISLLTQQASAGNAIAELFLSRLYLKGKGVQVDLGRSRTLLEDSAQRGQPLAQGLLGRELVFGYDGFERRQSKGMALLKTSALGGCNSSAVELGKIYTDGDPVPSDRGEGLVWYSLAAARGDGDGEAALGDHYYYGDNPNSDSDDFTPDYDQARFWYERSTASGSTWGEDALADLLSDLDYPKHDLKLAAATYGIAAAKGDAEAEFSLGELYSNASWSGRNVDEAYRYYRLAALNKDDIKRKEAITAIYQILNGVSAGVRQQFPPPPEPLELRLGRYWNYMGTLFQWGLLALFAILLVLGIIATLLGTLVGRVKGR